MFIYTQLRFQTDVEPVVLARFTQNLDEFPFDRIDVLNPPPARRGRVVRRAICGLHGYSHHSYEYELERAVRRLGCAVLHAHFGWFGSRSVRVARRLRVPLVTTFYGRDLSDPLDSDYEGLFDWGSLFVVEGPAMARELQGIGCPPEKIRVVPIGVDLAQFEFVARTRASPLIVMQTARFVEKKGIDLSIRAFAAARPSLDDAELWLVGDGALRPELESLASELGVRDQVKFFGGVSHAAYRALARRAHIGIHPSRTSADGDSEGGAPTVLLEMQAAGIPVVATRHADIPFVVPDPDALVAEGDVQGLARALVELASISDREYGQRASQGREFIEREHSAVVVAPLIAAVYREALLLAAEDGR